MTATARSAERRRVGELVAEHGIGASAVAQIAALVELIAGGPESPTSVREPLDVLDVHVADSLAGLVVPELREARKIADLGAGAGFPGLPLAVALPHARVHVVESAGRKADFLDRAREAMGLENVEVVRDRAESWAAGLGACDVVTARALAALPVLLEYAAPLLSLGGALVAWKGEVGVEEAARAARAAAVLGLEPLPARSAVPYRGSRHRTLHLFRKVEPTPVGYPRRPGMAVKRPLGR